MIQQGVEEALVVEFEIVGDVWEVPEDEVFDIFDVVEKPFKIENHQKSYSAIFNSVLEDLGEYLGRDNALGAAVGIDSLEGLDTLENLENAREESIGALVVDQLVDEMLQSLFLMGSWRAAFDFE